MPVSPSSKPNVVLMIFHDLGTHVGCHGIGTARTPNIDSFASQGVRFDKAFCTAPQCSPSRASLVTGQYPHSNGVMGLTHGNFAWDFHPGRQHLAELLKGLPVCPQYRQSVEALQAGERA